MESSLTLISMKYFWIIRDGAKIVTWYKKMHKNMLFLRTQETKGFAIEASAPASEYEALHVLQVLFWKCTI